MKPLSRYVKPQNKKTDRTHVSSVNITKEQHLFLEQNKVNLSQFVRDMLDELMKKAS